MSPEIKAGLRDSIPFGIGFVFLYLAIGMLGAAQSFSFAQIMALTLVIFSTPLQFLLIQTADMGWLLIPVILAMNARFLLMSATLVPYIKETHLFKIILSLILVVPSVFTGCLVQFKKNRSKAFLYFLSLGIPIYLVSILCTAVGFIVSEKLTSPLLFSMMQIVLPLQFTALAGKHWPDYLNVGSYWAGFFLAPLLVYVFHQYNLLLTPFLIGALVVLFENNFMRKQIQ